MAKLTAEEIEARDAARLNELGYKQVMFIRYIESKCLFVCLGTKKRIIGKFFFVRSGTISSITVACLVIGKLWRSLKRCLYFFWFIQFIRIWSYHRRTGRFKKFRHPPAHIICIYRLSWFGDGLWLCFLQ